MKPPAARRTATASSQPGAVTKVNSNFNIEVDGMTRHERNVRKR